MSGSSPPLSGSIFRCDFCDNSAYFSVQEDIFVCKGCRFIHASHLREDQCKRLTEEKTGKIWQITQTEELGPPRNRGSKDFVALKIPTDVLRDRNVTMPKFKKD